MPSITSSRTWGHARRRATPSTSSSRRRRRDRAERELAVAGADDGGQRRADPQLARRPAALPQHDHRRILLARPVAALLGDVARDREARWPAAPVGRGARPGRAPRAPRRSARRGRRGRRDGASSRSARRERRGVRAGAQQQVAEADRGDAARARSRRARRGRAARTRGCRPRAAVADPGLGVARRVELLALDDPGVEPGGIRPAARALEAVARSPPRYSQLPSSCATPPGHQVVARAGDDSSRRGRRPRGRRRGTRRRARPGRAA